MSKLTVRLSDHLYRKFRIRCFEKGLKIQDAIAGAVMDWLDPQTVIPENPAYMYSPDKDFMARVLAGEDHDLARAPWLLNVRSADLRTGPADSVAVGGLNLQTMSARL